MKVVHTPRHRGHDPKVEFESSSMHPAFEHVGRGEAIRAALAADPAFTLVEPDTWGIEPIAAVHDPGLIRFLGSVWSEYQQQHPGTREVMPDVFLRPDLRTGMGPTVEPASIEARLGWWSYEVTTPITEGTFDAALGAVDTALGATRLVLDGERAAYGLCRPPGHHAGTSLYGGYCFLNNAAVAAQHVVATTGVRVTILDVDYHHGNGTQQIFYERDDVQYVSLHADPVRAYPFITGFAEETGTGRGLGTTTNITLPPAADDTVLLAALDRAVEQVAAFAPELLIISLGLDTSIDDPIADLAVTADGFERCGAMIAELSLPTVVLQEGGYAVASLGENVRRWLLGLDRS
ncbi:MAG: histone deacetylase family protein [Acidobacteria bacterium]|nr:histone deacetylase family protein [Acidobacteriota bacterium]